jgi:hypothetical protein
MIISWAYLPSSSANTLSHTINTPTKVIRSCNKPSCLHVSKMCYKMHSHSFQSLRKLWYWDMWDVRNDERHWMYILLPCCLHITCPNIITFQETRLCECILLNEFPSLLCAPTFGKYVNQAISPQRYLSHSHFEWSVDEQICPLLALIGYDLSIAVAFFKKTKFLSQVSQPWQTSQAFCSMQRYSITLCLVPLQQFLLPHMTCQVCVSH